MLEFLQSFIDLLNKNQVLLTALGIGGAGTIIMWLKGVPQTIYNFLKREFTTEVTVTSAHLIFYNMMKFIQTKYKDKNFRKLKMINGRWGDGESYLSIGYGFHIIFYKGVPFFLTLSKDEANQTSQEKDSLSIMKIGRSHKIFEEFMKEADIISQDKSTIKVYKMESDWCFVKNQRKRNLESVFIESEKRERLLNAINNFINKEDWYLSHGVPYQLGILLYGPPGVGKTSLIKAIASYFDYTIYYLPSSMMSLIEDAVATLDDKSVLVIEDIDTNTVTNKRERDLEDNPISVRSKRYKNIVADEEPPHRKTLTRPTKVSSPLSEYVKMGLSEVLNSLDGIFAPHGRILIATTNHPEMLDPALIRPGRIDIKLEVGYINNEILEQFCNSFYPGNDVNFKDVKILKNNVTVALLQNMVLEGKELKDIISYMETDY